MNINLYSMESQMLQRKAEIEKAASFAWQEGGSKRNQIQIFRAMISKLKTVANTPAHVQTQAACCNCC